MPPGPIRFQQHFFNALKHITLCIQQHICARVAAGHLCAVADMREGGVVWAGVQAAMVSWAEVVVRRHPLPGERAHLLAGVQGRLQGLLPPASVLRCTSKNLEVA